ncbi:YdgA family protein [Raoultella terrigena]|uniref:YdgA family protein n=1 Tax=Raoultella terrigena TaxID=577 RepID=UPI0025B0EFA3|nr:YdgA family protein [Raoultella terrigena]WJV41183.1 YdgA family protein [Raoultella terrigena]
MKKSLVAAGIIVALGVVWTGGSWYTGKQLESRIAEVVQQANAQLQNSAPEAGLELGWQNYQRGLFSSHLQLVVKPAAGKESSWLVAGQPLVFDEVVSHGPFPLAALKSGHFGPSMASVKTTLVNNEASKALFDIAKGSTPFTIDTLIAYSGDSRSAIDLKPLDYSKGDEKVTFSGGQFQLNADRDGKAIALTGEAGSGQINAVNEYNQKVQLNFSNLKTDGATEMTSFNERIGKQKVSLEKLAIGVEGKELALLEGMNIDGKSTLTEDGKGINSQLDYTVNSLKLQNKDLGSGRLTVKLDNLDGQAWHQFSQQYNSEAQALMAKPELAQNPELYQQALTETFFKALPVLLKGNPSLTIAPLSWRNAKGESTFNLSILLKDPTVVTAPAQTLADEIDRSVKSLDGKLVVPVEMATEFMTQIAGLEGYQPADAAKLADQQVKGLAAMGQMFRITAMENNAITSSLQYAEGQVTLNGQKMPLDEFAGMFGLSVPAAPDSAPQSAEPEELVPPVTPQQ